MGTRVYFGNVSINKLQEIMGIELTKDDYEWLKQHHSESVNYDNKGFHIFELPSLQIHCGDGIVDELISRLSKYDWSNSKQTCSVVETIHDKEDK